MGRKKAGAKSKKSQKKRDERKARKNRARKKNARRTARKALTRGPAAHWAGAVVPLPDEVALLPPGRAAVAWIDVRKDELLAGTFAPIEDSSDMLFELLGEAIDESRPTPTRVSVQSAAIAADIRDMAPSLIRVDEALPDAVDERFARLRDRAAEELIVVDALAHLAGDDTAVELDVELLDIEPRIWRRVRVSDTFSLANLDAVLQAAYGWTNARLHEFRKGERRFVGDRLDLLTGDVVGEECELEYEVTIGELLGTEGSTLEYVYGSGSGRGWRHHIRSRGQAGGKGEPVAACLAGENASPPEDCGGPSGYVDLLAALGDPRHPGHAEAREWTGEDFDPAAFDPEATDAQVFAMLLPLPMDVLESAFYDDGGAELDAEPVLAPEDCLYDLDAGPEPGWAELDEDERILHIRSHLRHMGMPASAARELTIPLALGEASLLGDSAPAARAALDRLRTRYGARGDAMAKLGGVMSDLLLGALSGEKSIDSSEIAARLDALGR